MTAMTATPHMACLITLTLVTAAAPEAHAEDMRAPGAGRPHAEIWVGPMPFTQRNPRELREDYARTLANPSAWAEVLGQTDVFKSYIMVLPEAPLPERTKPELSDTQLSDLVALCRRRGLQVAFEVGGLRMGAKTPVKGQWGKAVARSEYQHLKRWINAGGRIDLLSTDHAIMMNLGHRTYLGTDCGLALDEVIEELADYHVEMARRIPGVRIGAIESLGFFHVTGPDGHEYARTVRKLPVWRFEEVFAKLVRALERRGRALDHFHIDFGYMGVRHDARVRGQADALDFGRVLGVEQSVREHGIDVGLVVNAFHDRRVNEPDADAASAEARERTLRLFEQYRAAGGSADHLLLQTWHPYPDRTGPETDPTTTLGVARDVLRQLPRP